MRRIIELDLTKSFIIIISLVGIHVMYELGDYESIWGFDVLNVLATAWGAPVFMFCMGITLGFSRHQVPGEWLRRGVGLITIGLVLNVFRFGWFAYVSHATGDPELMKGLAMIYNVDILQFAGLAFMLLALCKKLRMGMWSVLALSLVMNVAGTLLIGHHTDSYVVNQVLGFFYHTPTCSCFTLLNWFIFVAAGNVMGRIYRESDNVDRWFRYIIPVCGVIAVVHQYLSITGQCAVFRTMENDWEYYSMMTPDALCIAFGVAPFMVGVFRLVGRVVPESWMKVLGHPSRYITQYFCVSWAWIMLFFGVFYFVEKADSFLEFSLWYLIVLLLTVVSVVVYNRYLKEAWAPYLGTHRMRWCLAVWIILIGFGAWYFTTYPEPYIMPY